MKKKKKRETAQRVGKQPEVREKGGGRRGKTQSPMDSPRKKKRGRGPTWKKGHGSNPPKPTDRIKPMDAHQTVWPTKKVIRRRQIRKESIFKKKKRRKRAKKKRVKEAGVSRPFRHADGHAEGKKCGADGKRPASDAARIFLGFHEKKRGMEGGEVEKKKEGAQDGTKGRTGWWSGKEPKGRRETTLASCTLPPPDPLSFVFFPRLDLVSRQVVRRPASSTCPFFPLSL